MRKIPILLLLGLLFASPANAQSTISWGVPATSLDAQSSVINGQSFALISTPASVITWTVDTTGTVTSQTVVLQGSSDNSTWFTLDSSTSTTDVARTITTAVRFVRVSITAFGGGGGTTTSIITAKGAPWTANYFSGGAVINPILLPDGTITNPSLAFASETGTGLYRAGTGDFRILRIGTEAIRISSFEITARSDWTIGWGSTGVTTPDVKLSRHAANILKMVNGNNAQLFRFDSGAQGAASFGVDAAGQGQLGTHSNRELQFFTNDTDRWSITGAGHLVTALDGQYDIGSDAALRPRNYFGSGYIALGTSPSTTGVIRLSNNEYVSGRSTIPSDVTLIGINGDVVVVGATSRVTNLSGAWTTIGGTGSTVPALKKESTGLAFRLGDDSAYTWIRSLALISGTTAPSNTGVVRLSNTDTISARNSGNSADAVLLTLTARNISVHSGADITLNDGVSFDLTATLNGTLIVSSSDGEYCEFIIRGTSNAVTEKSDPGTICSTSSGTATSWNVFWNGSIYQIQNNRGAAKTFTMAFIGRQ